MAPCAVLLALALIPAGCGGAEDRFTSRVAARLRERYPETTVTVRGRLEIQTRSASGSTRQIHLANLWGDCQSARVDCDHAIERYLRLTAQEPETLDTYVKPETVRAVIKDAEWLENAKAAFVGKPAGKGDGIVSRPFVAGLSVAYVFDMPDGMRFVTREDLAALRLDAAGLDRLALANLEASLPPIADEPAEPGSAVRLVHAGDSYEASRLLLHERWKPVAARVKGDLLVAVPTRDFVFFTGSREDVSGLRAIARRLGSQAGHPLSTTLLRFTDDGWQAIP